MEEIRNKLQDIIHRLQFAFSERRHMDLLVKLSKYNLGLRTLIRDHEEN